MIQYFTNKTLSQKLSINLARWKRWSREFLPPDPLGGMQSGYARQYTPDEAFTVYLGGCLVSHLNFSIPDTRQILEDLRPWLTENGFRFDVRKTIAYPAPDGLNVIKYYMIFIMAHSGNIHKTSQINNRFYYRIRGIISTNPIDLHNHTLFEEQFTETCLPHSESPFPSLKDMHPIKVLNITLLLMFFIEHLDLEPDDFKASL